MNLDPVFIQFHCSSHWHCMGGNTVTNQNNKLCIWMWILQGKFILCNIVLLNTQFFRNTLWLLSEGSMFQGDNNIFHQTLMMFMSITFICLSTELLWLLCKTYCSLEVNVLTERSYAVLTLYHINPPPKKKSWKYIRSRLICLSDAEGRPFLCFFSPL